MFLLLLCCVYTKPIFFHCEIVNQSFPITVGKGQYFVLGDNRNNSEDSSHNGMGLVDSDRIVGKLWFTISPWKKIGFV